MLLKSQALSLVFSIALLISNTSYSEGNQKNATQANTENASPLMRAIYLSPKIIESEIELLSKKPYKLSRKELSNLKQQLNARFHPLTIYNEFEKNIQSNKEIAHYQEFLNSEEAQKFYQLQNLSLQKHQHSNIIDYQEKIKGKTISNTRQKLIDVFDGLNHESELQAKIIYHIKSFTYDNLDKRNKRKYHLPTQTDISGQLKAYNAAINLYAFKSVSTDDIIAYLDALNNHKKAIDGINDSLERVLDRQKSFNIKLP